MDTVFLNLQAANKRQKELLTVLDEMPTAIRRVAEEAIEKRKKAEADKEVKHKAGEKVYQTGTAAELCKLITDGFFEPPRTSREAYLKLNPDMNGNIVTDDQSKAIGKITDTLNKGRFPKLLDKLDLRRVALR